MADDQYLWVGPVSGSWDTASNWKDTTSGLNPAPVAPGASDAVMVGAAAGGAVQVITGTGKSLSLTLDGPTVLAGHFSTGAFTKAGQGNVILDAGDTLAVSGNAVAASDAVGVSAYGFVVDGAGSKLTVGGTLMLGGGGFFSPTIVGSLSLSNGGYVRAARLSIVGGVGGASVDAASRLEVGTAGGAASGTITVDAGAKLSIQGEGSFGYTEISAPTIVNKGTIAATKAFTIAATSAIDNSGTITLDNTFGAGSFSAPTIVNTGTIIVDDRGGSKSIPPTTQISGSVTGSGQIRIASDTALQLGQVGSGGSVVFTGSGSTLQLSPQSLDASKVFEARIVGFGTGDSIDYAGTVTSATYASGVLTLSDGSAVVAKLHLAGSYAGARFLAVSSGNGETQINVLGVSPLPIVVSSGHTSSGLKLGSDSTETMRSGGTASGTIIERGGSETVSGGGGHSVHLTLLGSFAASEFRLAGDGHGGTLVTDPPAAAGASPMTFADIAPARLHAVAAASDTPPSCLPGAVVANVQAYAGQTLLATGPFGGQGGGDRHPLLPAAR